MQKTPALLVLAVASLSVHAAEPFGFAVHLGSSDGAAERSLLDSGAAVVEGLARDTASRDAAREQLLAAGRYGQATVRLWSGTHLPYADGMVNALRGSDDITTAAEIERVLAPGGRWLRADGSHWTKPVPEAFDNWTHLLHDAGGTRASADTAIGPANHIRWIAGPAFGVKPRFVVDGRVIVLDLDGFDKRSPIQPKVYCRDAANGLLLWSDTLAWNPAPRRPGWGWGESKFQSLTHATVVDAQRFYATVDGGVRVWKLATGERERLIETAEPPLQLYTADQRLVAAGRESIRCFDVTSGDERWKTERVSLESRLADGVLHVLDGAATPYTLHAYALDSGEALWSFDTSAHWPDGYDPAGKNQHQPVRLCGARDGRLLVWIGRPVKRRVRTDHNEGLLLLCLDARTGGEVWRYAPAQPADKALGYANHVVFTADTVWTLILSEVTEEQRGKPVTRTAQIMVALDARTGRERRRMPTRITNPMCQPGWATPEVFVPRDNVVDAHSLEPLGRPHVGTRAGCGVSSIGGWGMTLNGSHVCGCRGGYTRNSNLGVKASAAELQRPRAGLSNEGDTRLVKGPAFGSVEPATSGALDWPCFLADGRRHNARPGELPAALTETWRVRLPQMAGSEYRRVICDGARLSPPTTAQGLVFVADPDAQTLTALDGGSGAVRWRFIADGVINGPPTIAEGHCVFGCGDGWLHTLRAADGQLAWRHRLARGDRSLGFFGKVQSTWPLAASALVTGEPATVVSQAGWYSHGDMRNWLYGIDLASGERLWQETGVVENPLLLRVGHGGTVHRREPRTGEQPKRKWGPELKTCELSYSLARVAPMGRSKKHRTRVWCHLDGRSTLLQSPETGFVGDELKQYSTAALLVIGQRPEELFRQRAPKDERWEALIQIGASLYLAGYSTEDDRGFLRVLPVAQPDDAGAELPLPARPVFMGLAPLGDQLVVTCKDGTVLALSSTARP